MALSDRRRQKYIRFTTRGRRSIPTQPWTSHILRVYSILGIVVYSIYHSCTVFTANKGITTCTSLPNKTNNQTNPTPDAETGRTVGGNSGVSSQVPINQTEKKTTKQTENACRWTFQLKSDPRWAVVPGWPPANPAPAPRAPSCTRRAAQCQTASRRLRYGPVPPPSRPL